METLGTVLALAIVFGLGYVVGRGSVRRVVVSGPGCQVIVPPTGSPVTIHTPTPEMHV